MKFKLGRLADFQLNPVMVKELRQMTRSRFLIGIVTLYMLIMLGAVSCSIFGAALFGPGEFQGGRNLFYALLPILNFSCLLFVPLYSGIRLALERSDTNLDLLFTTTLRPGEIIFGKLLNGMVMTILLYSICTPFLVFTYLLRGIDILTIGIILLPLFLVTMVAIQAALFIAVLPTSRAFKILAALFAFNFVIFVVGIGGTGMIYGMMSAGIADKLDSWDFWGPFLSLLGGIGLTFLLLYAFSVALIMPAAANRGLPIHLACAAVWLAVGLGLATWAYVEKSFAPLAAWAIPATIGYILVLFFAIGEDDQLRPRIRRDIPRPVFLRPLAFIFYSGAAGNIIFCCLAMAISLAISFTAARQLTGYERNDYLDLLNTFRDLAVFAVAYGFSAIALRRFLLKKWVPAKATGLIALLLLSVGALLPSIIGFLLTYQNEKASSIGPWQLFNPGGLLDPDFRDKQMIFVSGWALVMTLVNVPWLYRQARDFRPAPAAPGPAADMAK